MNRFLKTAALLIALALSGCATVPEPRPAPPQPVASPQPPKIAVALGGGAARGFAHIGVLKVLEAQGIVPEIVVGTSAGSLVGALYAAGHSGFEIQRLALQMDESAVSDWSLPNRGVIKGESLQEFVNRAVNNRPIEKLARLFGVVATDLQTGEMIVFRRGNTGMAVRASSSVPGVFQPVNVSGREYVDGGLTSPVPVKVAKSLGADIVIAVDIGAKPRYGKVKDTIDVLLQTFSIMGQSLSGHEIALADVVIRPNTGVIGATDFESRHLAILEGEKAAQEALPAIRSRIRQFMNSNSVPGGDPARPAAGTEPKSGAGPSGSR
ncbi:MAG: patatin-like phospholipase family protein [Betaproteobacteria bacterium]|nr:patatin-like phospholipase family protein [Betaproteobacteria bacterium]